MISGMPMKALMVEKGLSVKDLSDITGLCPEAIRNVIKGRVVTFSTLDTLCRVLRCQPCDLIDVRKCEQKGHWEFISD